MNCPQIYSIDFCVKQLFSKFFSRAKREESMEVWKSGSMEVPYPALCVERYALSVMRWALALALSLSLGISLSENKTD